METAKKISNACSNQCENAMNSLVCNQNENAKKIQHKSNLELPKNETSKTLPFSLFLNFETAKKIFGFTKNQCYETVKTITSSFDINLSETAMKETPKDVSNLLSLQKLENL